LKVPVIGGTGTADALDAFAAATAFWMGSA
jgi:hypothetical protein